MSDVERFEELLRSDETLQAKLREATEAYEGDKADERAVFEAIVAPLAAEVGLPFSYDEARVFATNGAALGDDELAAVAGGDGWTDEPDSSCIVIGIGVGGDACAYERAGIGACLGVGVGIFGF